MVHRFFFFFKYVQCSGKTADCFHFQTVFSIIAWLSIVNVFFDNMFPAGAKFCFFLDPVNFPLLLLLSLCNDHLQTWSPCRAPLSCSVGSSFVHWHPSLVQLQPKQSLFFFSFFFCFIYLFLNCSNTCELVQCLFSTNGTLYL